jgi:HlyD family secretion protein
MRRSWKRIASLSALAVVVVGVIAFLLWPAAVEVDLALAVNGPMRVTVDGEGRTRVRDLYTVFAPLAGQIQRVEKNVGDLVVAGKTVLMTLRPGEPAFLDARTSAQATAQTKAAEAAKALAAAELERARAEMEFAKIDRDRTDVLARRGATPERSRQRAELELATRQAAVASAQANLQVRAFELENARAALIGPADPSGDVSELSCCIDVRAPVSGRVLQVFRESEGVVQAGAPLIDIGDPREIEVVVDLLSTDATKTEAGAAVILEGWGGSPLAGKVNRVEPFGYTKVSALGIEEQRVNVIVDFTGPVERRAPLGHGYRVDARIVVWESTSVLKLPIGALFRDGDAWAVFAATDRIARMRHVHVGHMTLFEAEILDGVAVDEPVVLHPSDRVHDGTPIKPRSANADPG